MEGTYEAIGNDGEVRLTAYKKLRLPHESQPYLYIRSSIPKSSVVSKANTTMFRNMAALMSVFAIGLILAAFIGRHLIVDPITKLKEASRQLAVDPTPVNISEKVKDGELGELAQAFDDMAESLLLKEKEQLAAEEELRQSYAREAWLARFPEENPNPVLRVSVEGKILYCNPAAAKSDAWRCEISRLVPAPLLSMIKQALEEGREVQQDVELGERVYSVTITLFLKEGYVNVYGRDVTERKKAEEALKKNLERFRALVTASSEVLYRMSPDWSQMRQLHSDGFLANTERPDSNWLQEYIHPDDQPHVSAVINEAIRTKSVFELEHRVRRVDGSIGWTFSRAVPLMDGNGEIIEWFGAASDITERKQMEEDLRKAKDELEKRVAERTYELYVESLYARSLIEASLDPLVTISINGKITDVNRATEEGTGVPREQLIGSDFSDYFTEPEKARAGYKEVFRQGYARDYPLELKHQDGHVTPVLYNASVYRDETGRIMGVFAAARDITERKRAESALRKLASELVMAEERERKRIAGVLHDDVAQTLAAVKMRIDMIRDTPSDQDLTLKEAKALLLQSIQETRALMSDIGNPLLSDLGLQAACDSLANRLMEKHQVRITCDIQDAYKHLNADVKTLLYQVVRELLNNVVKHSKARNAHVKINMGNGYFHLKVTDDGVGFDPHTIGVPSVEGGFGLYSIRERLISINGRLWIESTLGRGTEVTADIPAVLD